MTAVPDALPAVQPDVDTLAAAGRLSALLDSETTRLLLGEVPAAFHTGVQDILLIAYGMALAEFLEYGACPDRYRRRGPRARRSASAPDIDLSRTVGWFTAKYPVSLAVGGLSWSQVVGGRCPARCGGEECQGTASKPARRPHLRPAAVSQRRRRTARIRSAHRLQLPRPPRRHGRGWRRRLADLPLGLAVHRHRGHRSADADDAHRRADRRNRRDRLGSATARRMDVGPDRHSTAHQVYATRPAVVRRARAASARMSDAAAAG